MMKNLKSILFILLVLLCGCNDEEQPHNAPTALSLEITAQDFQSTDSPATRITETGYITAFSTGDKIGLFVLKDGKIVDGMNNISCSYNATTGQWTPSGDLFYYDDAQYIAYYPFSMDMDNKKTIDEIKSTFVPKTDQSNYTAGYSASCLMTATGTANASTKKLSFDFSHAMAMLELQFYQNYNAPEKNVLVESGSTIQVLSSGQTYTFNEQSADKRYRLLLKPESVFDFQLTFIVGGVTYNYSATGVSMPVAGKYLHYDLKVNQNTVTLSTGNYEGVLGEISKIQIGETYYNVNKLTNSTYTILGLGRAVGAAGNSIKLYINDNAAKNDSKEQLLLTTSRAVIDSDTETVTVNLSINGMEGAGTSATDPYLVTTAVQLRGVGLLGEGNNNAETEYYEQKNDIDLSMYTDWNPVKSGKLYDGKHYKINNLVSTKGGVFSYNGGTIQNVHLASGTITVGNGTVGGITNWSVDAKIYNCSNAATIKTNSGNSGGIAGDIQGNSLVSHCKNTGPITAISVDDNTGNCGGIVGESHAHTNCLLEYCYNTGNINGLFRNGGIINLSYTPIKYCYSIGDVSESASHSWGYIASEFSGNLPITDCWSAKKPFASNHNDEISGVCTLFNAVGTNSWPVYDSGTGDGWTSEHWKSFAKGEYPKLFWEE